MKALKIIGIVAIITAVGYVAYDSVQTRQAEKEFNESGRAKAIEQESDLWPLYADEASGFSFQYPHGVVVVENPFDAGGALRVTVDVMDVDEMPERGPLSFDAETVAINTAALSRGEYGQPVDNPLPESQRVRALDGANAQDFVVLGRFEVCNVVMERKLYFLNGDTQVIITLHGPQEHIMQEAAQYFTVDPANCGEEIIWVHDMQADFYNQLVSGSGGSIAQEWFDTFDQIADTVEVWDVGQAVAPDVAPVSVPPPTLEAAQVANPASIHCEAHGGTLEIRRGERGEYGICIFEDGSSCEEWAFFRGECREGENR